MSDQKRLQILHVEPRRSKTGNPYHVAQCIVMDGDIPKVGEFWHFNSELTLEKGEFYAETVLDVYDGKVGAKIVGLKPVGRVAPAAPVAPKA